MVVTVAGEDDFTKSIAAGNAADEKRHAGTDKEDSHNLKTACCKYIPAFLYFTDYFLALISFFRTKVMI